MKEGQYMSEEQRPYRSEKDALRDTGRQPKHADEREHMSAARTFDTLVSSNLALVKTVRMTAIAMGVFTFMATMASAASAYMLHQGQLETRNLLITISQRPRLCTEVVSSEKKQ